MIQCYSALRVIDVAVKPSNDHSSRWTIRRLKSSIIASGTRTTFGADEKNCNAIAATLGDFPSYPPCTHFAEKTRTLALPASVMKTCPLRSTLQWHSRATVIDRCHAQQRRASITADISSFAAVFVMVKQFVFRY